MGSTSRKRRESPSCRQELKRISMRVDTILVCENTDACLKMLLLIIETDFDMILVNIILLSKNTCPILLSKNTSYVDKTA
jgi:hypothetical protein